MCKGMLELPGTVAESWEGCGRKVEQTLVANVVSRRRPVLSLLYLMQTPVLLKLTKIYPRSSSSYPCRTPSQYPVISLTFTLYNPLHNSGTPTLVGGQMLKKNLCKVDKPYKYITYTNIEIFILAARIQCSNPSKKANVSNADFRGKQHLLTWKRS